jgi:cellobiose-specific phosphotransferase system component IIB
MKRQAEPYGVPVKVIPKQIYAMIDGDALVDLALQTVSDNKSEV